MGIYDGLLRVYRNLRLVHMNLRLVHMNLRLVHMNLRLVHMNALCFSSIVLREWLFQHRYNAYPTRAETLILAMKTELTTKQVRTWFINARRRILPEIIRREGREPEKFLLTRSCFSFFCSTTVTDPTSSTPFSSCPCLENNALSQHQSLHIFTTFAP